MQAVILAGGRGIRLRPYTRHTPKPLLPLDGMPILEILIRQLVAAGCSRITLALAWMAEAIRAHFDDGAWLGAQLSYSISDQILGTAGPLALLEVPAAACLVVNADILTSLDFRIVLDAHPARRLATVVTQRREVPIRYGVIDTSSDGRVLGIREKPPLSMQINTGIYVLDPAVWRHLAPGVPNEMPVLLHELALAGEEVGSYEMPAGVHWTDIGVEHDYLNAGQAFRANRARYLPGHDQRPVAAANARIEATADARIQAATNAPIEAATDARIGVSRA